MLIGEALPTDENPVGDKMSLRSRAIDLEEDFIDWMTDPENVFWMLTMYPGIGLPLQLGRRGYDWYNYGDTMTMQDAQELAKWGLAREAIWYGVYASTMNISKEGYRAFRGRGGVATGQLVAGVAKGLWSWRNVLGVTALFGTVAHTFNPHAINQGNSILSIAGEWMIGQLWPNLSDWTFGPHNA